jgi:hypothetical protein
MKVRILPTIGISLIASFIALGMIHFEFPQEIQAIVNYIAGVITISTLVILSNVSKK